MADEKELTGGVDVAVDQMKSELQQNLTDARDEEVASLINASNSIVDEIGDKVIDEAAEAIIDIGDAIKANSNVESEIQEIVADVQDKDKTIPEKIGDVIHGAGEVALEVVEGIGKSMPEIQHELSEGVHDVFNDLIEVLKKHKGEVTQEAYDIVKKLITLAIQEALDNVRQNFWKFALDTIKSILVSLIKSIFRVK